MTNEELILQAAKDSGVFKQVLDKSPTGACRFPLFILELSDTMEFESSISPTHDRYNVSDEYIMVLAVRAEPGKELEAKAKLKPLLKAFLTKLFEVVDENQPLDCDQPHFQATDKFQQFPFVLGGKHTMMGRLELSREAHFDLTD